MTPWVILPGISGRDFEPELQLPVCRQVVAGPRNHTERGAEGRPLPVTMVGGASGFTKMEIGRIRQAPTSLPSSAASSPGQQRRRLREAKKLPLSARLSLTGRNGAHPGALRWGRGPKPIGPGNCSLSARSAHVTLACMRLLTRMLMDRYTGLGARRRKAYGC